MIKLGGGCKHLYSSKDIANNNQLARKKPKNVHIFLTNSKTNPIQTLVTKYFSPSKKEKEPPRDSAPLHSIRQEINQ
jgi:hypothetical protein